MLFDCQDHLSIEDLAVIESSACHLEFPHMFAFCPPRPFRLGLYMFVLNAVLNVLLSDLQGGVRRHCPT